MYRSSLLFVGALLLSFLLVGGVSAQGDSPPVPSDDQVNAIAKNLYCPVCPNTPLDVCETQACMDWRAQIRDQLAAGWSEEQIVDYFVAQYGERVLAEPKRSGFTSLVWVLPVIAISLGLGVTWQVLKKWRSNVAPATGQPSTQPMISPELKAQIEQALRELD